VSVRGARVRALERFAGRGGHPIDVSPSADGSARAGSAGDPSALDPRRLAVRFVDEQSGRNDLLGRVAALEAMAAVVARRLEGSRAGSRFPLLRSIGRREPLSASECEALAREVARLRQHLAPVPATTLSEEAPGAIGDDVPAAAATLADAFAVPLSVLEHIARLGAASRRGARFEIGDAAAFARARTPLAVRDV
jgi:hypothetical protein